jgi:hypothetical protein
MAIEVWRVASLIIIIFGFGAILKGGGKKKIVYFFEIGDRGEE